jgi:capsular polysaccharide biosynthesis protein
MRQDLLRAKMLLKRKLFQGLGYRPERVTSVSRLERTPNILFEHLSNYSKTGSVEIIDPRNNRLTGHYFQERSAHLLKNVILEPRQGLIYSSHGELICESTCWSPHQAYRSFPWNPPANSPRLALKSAIYITSNSFWHWLIEDLACTIFSLSLDAKSSILVADNPPRYVLDFLATTGRDVIFLKGPVQVESLIMVEKSHDSGWPHAKDILELQNYPPFKSFQQEQEPSTRLYVSRRGSRRSPKNESEVESLFQSYNFVIHKLEELDLLSEIKVLSDVSLFAGIHGAGLANQIWMPAGGVILDIVDENYWTESIHRLATLSQHKYEFLPYDGASNGEVPLAQLEMKLQEITSL